MKKRQNPIDICRLCKIKKELTFEHIPPRSAFNKNTKYKIIDNTEYYVNFLKYQSKELTYRSRVEQGGLGEFCLCADCNNFLGRNYVNEYTKFAKKAMSILNSAPKNAKGFEFDISDIDLLKFIKQVISIFICSNDIYFTDEYNELIDFVKNSEDSNLPERYRVYMYLNNEGVLKNGGFHLTNNYGIVCEFTYPPFGFVLSIDNPNQIMEVSEITAFKYYNKIKDNVEKLPIILNKYATNYPFPLDFR